LKEENKWFNKKIKEAGKYVGATMKENRQLEKENKKLRKNYYNLSKIVETT
jgi:regulator of replication initiation timing